MATIENYGSGEWIVVAHDTRTDTTSTTRFATREEAVERAREARSEMRRDRRRHTAGEGSVGLFREGSAEDFYGESEKF